MNKIKVEKYLDGKEYEVKVGELNFEMEFDLKKVLGLVVESEIEDNRMNVDDYIEYYNDLNCCVCNNVDDIVNDIIDMNNNDIEELKGEWVLSEEGFCRIYKDGVLVVG